MGPSPKTTENPGYSSTGPRGAGLAIGGPIELTAQSDNYLSSDRGVDAGLGGADPRSRSIWRDCLGQAAGGSRGGPVDRRSAGDGDHDDVVEVADSGMISGIRSMGEATHSPAIIMAILVQRGRPTCGATRIYRPSSPWTPRLVQDPETRSAEAGCQSSNEDVRVQIALPPLVVGRCPASTTGRQRHVRTRSFGAAMRRPRLLR